MANLYTTNTARFKPFSFQEMLQPYQIYTEAYNKVDEELNTLLEDAATKGFNFMPQDVNEKETYNNMMLKLKQASDDLLSGNSNAFKTISNLNKEYRKTMIPINQKITKRSELVKEQRLLQKANPYIRFDKDYSTESLNNITDASTYNTYDLSTIYTNAAKDTASLIAGLHREQVGTPTRIEGTDYYSIISGYGFTPDEWDENMQDKDSALYKYVQTAKEKATKGISNTSIKSEIEAGVEETIRNNIGKFESYRIQGTNQTQIDKLTREQDLFDYMYDEDENGNLIMSKQYQDDQLKLKGYTWNAEKGTWEKPITPSTANPYNGGSVIEYTPEGSASIRIKKLENSKLGISSIIEGKHLQKSEDGKYTGYPLTFEEIMRRTLPNKFGVYNAALQLLNNDPELARYYDFMWVDTAGRGGTLVRVPKKKQTNKVSPSTKQSGNNPPPTPETPPQSNENEDPNAL